MKDNAERGQKELSLRSFLDYFENEWKDNSVMSTEDFLEVYPGVHRNIIRHYLNKLVDMGLIFMIKESHKTMWYIKMIHYEEFLPFKYLNEKMSSTIIKKNKEE